MRVRSSAATSAAALGACFVMGCSSGNHDGLADAGTDAGIDARVGTGDATADLRADQSAASDAARDSAVVDAARDAELGDVGDVGDLDDVGPCIPPPDEPEPFTELPMLLSETGLYADTAGRILADSVRTFEPQHVLWSDGASKTRWVWLPECSTIDTSDPDHWVVPVGAKFWKQFVVDGRVIETRLIHRFGPGVEDFVFGAYVWTDDETDAVLTPAGQVDARATTHDVPDTEMCEECHTHLPERILGFSAIQLNHSRPGVVLDDLVAENRLTDALPATLSIPGDAADQEFLGYLHANCGNCHNDTFYAVAFILSPMSLRVSAADTEVSQTGVGRTAIDVPRERIDDVECTKRIDPGSPSTSCILQRMQARGIEGQMPPVGTEVTHDDGLRIVGDWIESLPPN